MAGKETSMSFSRGRRADIQTSRTLSSRCFVRADWKSLSGSRSDVHDEHMAALRTFPTFAGDSFRHLEGFPTPRTQNVNLTIGGAGAGGLSRLAGFGMFFLFRGGRLPLAQPCQEQQQTRRDHATNGKGPDNPA